jgi:hypothetical protein
MRDHELDRILSVEDELVPSSGFLPGVMDRVRMEASAPAPIPFPWKRALPGLLLSILTLVAMCVTVFLRPVAQRVQEASGPSIFIRLTTDLGGWLSAANVGGLYWIILALVLTLVSVKLSLRLIGSR